MSRKARSLETPADFRDAVRDGDRRAVAQAITRIESTRPDQAAFGQAILDELIPATGGATRVGVTGPPGVGKSSLIEALGLQLVEAGHRVAVLAVDPSSPVTGGSILGDKTRMEELSKHPDAFIRPTPTGGSLGGVAQRTREVMLLCEAAGYDVVLIETVGIGQSEVAVSSMVDFFLVLLLPGGGDELQGIKKGVMELADALVVNKADGEGRDAAERTRAEYAGALSLMRQSTEGWQPRVFCASALTGDGVAQLWKVVTAHRQLSQESGALGDRRRRQARDWLRRLLDEGLGQRFRAHPGVRKELERLEAEVQELKVTPGTAARRLFDLFFAS